MAKYVGPSSLLREVLGSLEVDEGRGSVVELCVPGAGGCPSSSENRFDGLGGDFSPVPCVSTSNVVIPSSLTRVDSKCLAAIAANRLAADVLADDPILAAMPMNALPSKFHGDPPLLT